MGILDGLKRNASEVDVNKVDKDFAPLLASKDKIKKVFNLIKNMLIFTDKQPIIVDKLEVTGKNTDNHPMDRNKDGDNILSTPNPKSRSQITIDDYREKLIKLLNTEDFEVSFIDVLKYGKIYPIKLIMIEMNGKSFACEPYIADKHNFKSKYIKDYFGISE